jgi:hypothetical protein
MIPEQQAQLNLHIRAIANILYQQSDVNQLHNLATIEETIREQTLKYITPQIGFFLSKTLQTLSLEDLDTSEVLLVNYPLLKNKPLD